jgi:hypothetical protein
MAVFEAAAARAERALDPRSDLELTRDEVARCERELEEARAEGVGAEQLADAEGWLEEGRHELAVLELAQAKRDMEEAQAAWRQHCVEGISEAYKLAVQTLEKARAEEATAAESPPAPSSPFDEWTYRDYHPLIDSIVDENDYDGLRIADALATDIWLATIYRVMMQRGNAKAMFTLVALAHAAVGDNLTGRTRVAKRWRHMKAAGIFRDRATEARKLMSTTPITEVSWPMASLQADWCDGLLFRHQKP